MFLKTARSDLGSLINHSRIITPITPIIIADKEGGIATKKELKI